MARADVEAMRARAAVARARKPAVAARRAAAIERRIARAAEWRRWQRGFAPVLEEATRFASTPGPTVTLGAGVCVASVPILFAQRAALAKALVELAAFVEREVAPR